MTAIFLNAFSRSRGAILGWGLSLALLGAYLMPFYDTLAKQQESLKQLLSSYPPELMAFFGDTSNMSALFTPEGYLGFEFFSYMPLILGIYAVLVCSGILAGDEENGTLDLVLAHPVSRAALFFGRVLAFVAATVSILALTWLGLFVGKNWSSVEFSGVELARPFVSLCAVVLLFGAMALALSLLLPARRLAAMVAGLFLVASFFVTSLARIDATLEKIAQLSPLNYYQSGQAILGLNGDWIAGLLATAGLFVLIAWWRFERRDIRVGGEGGWQWPVFRRKLARR
jgi:ABC-2 type transport system permease protein